MIVVRDREAGNIIEQVNSYDEGEEVLARFEAEDKAEGIYEEDFYEVAIVDLKSIRKWRGLTQKALAEKSGVNQRTIENYECGKTDLKKASIEIGIALAKALNCRVEDLV